MPESSSLHVLVIEDDPDTRTNLQDILELDGHRTSSVGTVAEALALTDWPSYDVILLDYKLPDGSAESLLPRLQQLAPHAAVIISTGLRELGSVIVALRHGAADYILKPIDADALRASLARLAERRRLAAAKERSEAAFRSLVEAAPCLIVITRPDRTMLYFSRFAEEVTGYGAAEVLGRQLDGVLLADAACRQTFGNEVGRMLAGAPPVRGLECSLQAKDGRRLHLVWNAATLPDYEGGPAVLLVGQDVTRLVQAQEKALQAERLAAIGQMVTGLAHESGNALARSQACLEMLSLEVPDRPAALDLIARIQKAQDHLRQLYEEVRSYAAPLRLEREVWDVSAVWRQAWTNLAVLREGRRAELREQPGGANVRCSVDPFRLEQVFRNILENALAACADPVAITISVREERLQGRPALRVSVRDNGPGLTAEQRQRIFEPLFTTKTKGTGLGMAIAKRIVEAHGGQLAVGSDSGPGAEILLTLPRELS